MSKGSVTVADAVKRYGIGRSRLYQLMTDGELVYSQFGARRLIPCAAIEKLIVENLVGAEAAK